MSPVLDSVRSAPSRALSAAQQPAVQTDLLQISKSVAAALIAWVLAVNVFELSQAFLAPWTALMAVHLTVHRSVSRGAQTVAATVLGIVLSYLAVELFGMGLLALGVTLFAGLLVARLALLREEGVTAATTALFVLTTSYTLQESLLLDRVFDVLLGVSVGVLVNFVVVPPCSTEAPNSSSTGSTAISVTCCRTWPKRCASTGQSTTPRGGSTGLAISTPSSTGSGLSSRRLARADAGTPAGGRPARPATRRAMSRCSSCWRRASPRPGGWPG